MKKVVLTWENTVVLVEPDEGLHVKNIQRYMKAVWPTTMPKRIVKHKEW